VRYYVRTEIERFLRAVDLALKRPATIILIGGGAAAVKYRIDDPTTDIDTFNVLGTDLRHAIDTARKATGLPVPFEQSGVADGPYDFEDRLLRAMPSLARLTILVPERHDLALMKTVRGDQADFAKLRAIHARNPLDLSVLLQRYEHEMSHVVIDPRRLKGNFLALVESLFPEAATLVEKALVRPEQRSQLDAYLTSKAGLKRRRPSEGGGAGTMKMKRYATFDKYLADQTPKNQSVIRALRKFVKRVAPQLQESVKWGNGCWVKGTVPVSYVYSAPDYVQLGFFAGSTLKDPKKLLQGEGKFVRHIKVRKPSDIDERAIGALLRQAVR
jgi:hypothetical protein